MLAVVRDLDARLRLRLLDLRRACAPRAPPPARVRRPSSCVARARRRFGADGRALRASVRPPRRRAARPARSSWSRRCREAIGERVGVAALRARRAGGGARAHRDARRRVARRPAPLRARPTLRAPRARTPARRRAARRPRPIAVVARLLGGRQLGAQREQLGAAAQRSGPADAAREPDRAARVDERRAVVHGAARGRAARAPTRAPGPTASTRCDSASALVVASCRRAARRAAAGAAGPGFAVACHARTRVGDGAVAHERPRAPSRRGSARRAAPTLGRR